MGVVYVPGAVQEKLEPMPISAGIYVRMRADRTELILWAERN